MSIKFKRRTSAWAVLPIAAGLLAGLAAAAVPASATTLTCTGTQNQAVPPFGCGGAQLAYQAKGVLDLAVLGTAAGSTTGNYWNSPVGFLADSQSATREDFTVFAVGGDTHDGPGGLGEYVAVYTPDGKFASFTQGGSTYTNAVPQPGPFTIGTDVYALSVENLNDGPKGALRWHVVLRNANTNGTFWYGNNGQLTTSPVSSALYFNVNSSPVSVKVTSGAVAINGVIQAPALSYNVPAGGYITVTGTTPAWTEAPASGQTPLVLENYISPSHANAFQVWAPVSASAGLEFINESLSHGFHGHSTGDTPYVLDDRSFGGSGTAALAFPENDGLNQQESIIGCSYPVLGLDTGYQFCP